MRTRTKIMSAMLGLAVVVSPLASVEYGFTNVVKANSTFKNKGTTTYYNSLTENEKEKLIIELAEALRKIDEEISVKNKKGEITNFKMNILEEKIDNKIQFNKLKETVDYDNRSIMFRSSVTYCAKNALIDFVGGEALGAMIKGGIVKYFERKAWMEVAKIAVKFAIKDLSPYMIAGSLAWSFGRCMTGW